MNYEVHLTRTAREDLNEAADYIEYELMNPQAADEFLVSANDTLSSLKQFAQRYSLVEDPVLRALGIRFVRIKKFLAFYVIAESERKVHIVRVLYERRNWIDLLAEGYTLN